MTATGSLTTLGRALLFKFLQPLSGALDGLGDHSPIQLNLRLTWATSVTNAASLPLKVRPPANQTGAQILQARQFNLKLALV